jgi:hypothetical protein
MGRVSREDWEDLEDREDMEDREARLPVVAGNDAASGLEDGPEVPQHVVLELRASEDISAMVGESMQSGRHLGWYLVPYHDARVALVWSEDRWRWQGFLRSLGFPELREWRGFIANDRLVGLAESRDRERAWVEVTVVWRGAQVIRAVPRPVYEPVPLSDLGDLDQPPQGTEMELDGTGDLDDSSASGGFPDLDAEDEDEGEPAMLE